MKYLEVGIGGNLVYGMFDTGANVTIISSKLANQLALPMYPYHARFRQAAGHVAKFVAKLGLVNLQLHDNLIVSVDGIRVMDS